jgi:cation diffusion facilitator family transporter
VRQAVARGARLTVFGIVASVLLATVKILTGWLGNSYALIADGVESVLDVVSSLIVLGSFRFSIAPRSERFPYGVGKVESLAAIFIATMLLLAALGIAIQAVREILEPHHGPAPFTLAVLVIVVVIKETMFRVLWTGGTAIGSHALRTDAWHHRSDAITSLAAGLGITVALIGGERFATADDWAALFACVIIGVNGVRLFRSAAQEVLDVAAPEDVRRQIRDLASTVAGVSGIDVLRVRRSGLVFLVDIHVEVAAEISVRDGHTIAHRVKAALLESDLPILDVLVHIEPDA